MKKIQQKLYRSRTDRMIAGVCGGLAAWFALDSSIVRLLMVLLFFFGGVSFLCYVILWIIIPVEPIHPRTRTIDH